MPVRGGTTPAMKYFLSHAQGDSRALAQAIYYEGKNKDMDCWLDIMQSDKSVAGMEAGVKNCDVVIVIVSPTYFERAFCMQELLWAQQYGKVVQPIHDVNNKLLIGAMMDKALPEFKWIGSTNMLSADTGEMRMFGHWLELVISDAAKLSPCPKPTTDFVNVKLKMTKLQVKVDNPTSMTVWRKSEKAFYCHEDWASFGRMEGWGWKKSDSLFKAWTGGNPPEGTVIISCWRKNEMTYYCHQGWEHYGKMNGWGWTMDSYQFHAYPPEVKAPNTVPILQFRKAEKSFLLPKGHAIESSMPGWGWTYERVCCNALAM